MSYALENHPECPYYDFTVNNTTGGGSITGLTFSKPLSFDDVSIRQADRDALIAAIVGVLEQVQGVNEVRVTLYDHTSTDVTPA